MDWSKLNWKYILLALGIGVLAALIFFWDPFFSGLAFVAGASITIILTCLKRKTKAGGDPPKDGA